MRLAAAIALVLTLSPGGIRAETSGDLAKRASGMLSDAAGMLAAAESATDRIAALTETVRAYETGLAAMREGLRAAEFDRRGIAARLAAEDAEIAGLLTLLQAVSRETGSETLVHPGSAPDTIRAGTLAAAVVPALHEMAAGLEADLRAQNDLIALQESGAEMLSVALTEVRQARLDLSRAVSERTDLPPALATDEAAMEALINSAETLAAFADSLLPEDASEPAIPDGDWRMPVLGQLVHRFDEPDAAGVRRPGWVIAADPLALVTAPAAATVRFTGTLPGQGGVAILEPEPGQLLILAGLGEIYARMGQIVSAGEAIALMGGAEAAEQQNLNETALGSGQLGGETLYMEIRQGEAPVDPAGFVQPPDE